MSNFEQGMKAVAAALTGKKVDIIPDKLEDICFFIAENYTAPETEAKTARVKAVGARAAEK